MMRTRTRLRQQRLRQQPRQRQFDQQLRQLRRHDQQHPLLRWHLHQLRNNNYQHGHAVEAVRDTSATTCQTTCPVRLKQTQHDDRDYQCRMDCGFDRLSRPSFETRCCWTTARLDDGRSPRHRRQNCHRDDSDSTTATTWQCWQQQSGMMRELGLMMMAWHACRMNVSTAQTSFALWLRKRSTLGDGLLRKAAFLRGHDEGVEAAL